MKTLLFQTDWLASRTVFYHEKTGKVSPCINNVIDYSNLEIDPEGLNNYLTFGYSILEKTPIKYVKFLRHSSCLFIDENGEFTVEYLDDPVDQWLDRKYSEEDIFKLIQLKIQKWEESVEGEIIIPTSGGYDSRLLNYMIKDKTRIRSFTYGISQKQSDSYEVVYAQRLSEILGTRWEEIFLGEFHKYFEDWDQIFGPSTHSHGMYHIEFYSKILSLVDGGNPFLSGIIGDAWAGLSFSPLKNWENLLDLSYSHGLHSDATFSKFETTNNNLKKFWEDNKDRLKDERIRVIESMRFKIRLLSYLIIVPEQFGFKPWSPFLDIEVAMAMLNLPPERRKNRIWMKDFFEQNAIDLESMELKASRENVLDLYALQKIPVNPLNINILQEVVIPDYIAWINKNVSPKKEQILIDRVLSYLSKISKIQGLIDLFGIKNQDKKLVQLKAYNNYLILLPIEKMLKKGIRVDSIS